MKRKIKVTDSCGCVFCDINLKPQKHDGKLMHYVRAENKWVPCLKGPDAARYALLTADTDRLDWLEDNAGWSLVSDDAGRWALVTDGTQNVPDHRMAIDIVTTFWIKKADWHSSIRSAIDAVSTKRKRKKK